MKKKIFVGNLSWKVTDEVLKQVFTSYGTVVSARVVMDQYTGKSRGFAFVEMETSEAASAAIEALDQQPLLDRPLRLSFAEDKKAAPRTGGGDRGDRGGDRGDRGDRGGDRGGRGDREDSRGGSRFGRAPSRR